MRYVALACMLVSFAGAVIAQPSTPPAMKCEIGPVSREFGGTNWIIYSCDDAGSLVFVSARGNPAFPYTFLFIHEAGRYTLQGAGTGDKQASKAAGDAISALPAQAIAVLLAETRKIGKPRN